MMNRHLLGLFGLWLALLAIDNHKWAWAQKPSAAPNAVVPEIASFFDDETFGLIRVNVDRIQVQPLYALLAQVPNMKAFHTFPSEEQCAQLVKLFRSAGGNDLYIVLSTHDLHQGGPFVIVPIARGANAAVIQTLLSSGALKEHFAFETVETFQGSVFAGSRSTLEHLRDLKTSPRPELAPALAATSESTLQFMLLPAEDHRRVAEQVALPLLMGKIDVNVARALSWVSIGVDGPPQPRVKIVVEASDAPAAERLRAASDVLLAGLEKNLAVRLRVPQFEEIRKLVDWKINGKTLSIELDDQQGKLSNIARVSLQPAIEQAAGQKEWSETMEQLKQLGLALQNYHSSHKSFPPPAILSKEGKPLLSWRVALLPFFEEGEESKLYEQFHLDEPWDSPHNKPLIAKMPSIYRCPRSKAAGSGRTVFLVPRGDTTAFPGPDGIRIRDIIDGTSKTIAVVEVDDEHAVPWTKPDDWNFDPEKPTEGLGGHFPGFFHTAFCDGAAHAFEDTIDKNVLRALLTRAGRETVAIPDFGTAQ